MEPIVPFTGPPKNRGELLYRIKELKARKTLLETEMDENVKDIVHELSPMNLLSRAADNLMSNESTSTFILRTGVSQVLGFALRNLLFPSAGRKLIGGIALKGAQKLFTDKIVDNRDLISNGASLIWKEIRSRFGGRAHSGNGYHKDYVELK